MNSKTISADIANPIHAALVLSLTPGIGPRTYRLLVECLGSPQQVLEAAPSTLRDLPGIGTKLARSISMATEQVDITGELQRCDQHSISLLPLGSESYPTRLAEIFDPPALLYCRGKLLPQDDLAIAIVGTRHATHYGVRQAERLSRSLAMAGFTIVSGMARGVDAAAHRGALQAEGRTIAVLGSGLMNIYPAEHADLSLQIAEQGAVLSEYPTLQSPKSGAFPQRNRLVTGLSLGVIVIEAAERSGALISARHAMEQGREVFALPGQVDNRMARGCHQLIRDGAKLVESIDDVIEELGPLASPVNSPEQSTLRHPAETQLNDQEQIILQAIASEPTEIDLIVDKTGLPVHRILATVSVLEMRHLVRRVSGTALCRN